MVLTREDELTLAACREVLKTCERYHTRPAPHFTLLLRMHAEMEQLGLLQKQEEEPKDFCAGCPADRKGNCLNGYQLATLSLDGRSVSKCGYRRIAEQEARRRR